jgi:lipid-binding SYLF domain-containing protein
MRIPATVLVAFALATATSLAQSDEARRISESVTVLSEIMEAGDQSVPRAIFEKAEGIAVFPSLLKGGFIIGGQRGRGILSARDSKTGEWSSPAFLTITGGSIGAQIGGQAVDLILVVQNRRGLEQLVSNQFKIGRRRVGGGRARRTGRQRVHRHPDAGADPELFAHARLFAGITSTVDDPAGSRRERSLLQDGLSHGTDRVRGRASSPDPWGVEGRADSYIRSGGRGACPGASATTGRGLGAALAPPAPNSGSGSPRARHARQHARSRGRKVANSRQHAKRKAGIGMMAGLRDAAESPRAKSAL